MVSMPPRRLAVAPMLDWTDTHYRYLARQITRYTWLYSEMINANAVVYGNTKQLLTFNKEEQPIALQLGGSEPKILAQAAKIGESYGYNEINLNCGCPSPRVQKGIFGACLMNTPSLVAECINAMQQAVQIPVSVKHRIGIDQQTDYAFLRDFVGTLSEQSGCTIFIIHARNAWLNGLSPKENREIPPLKYGYVYRIKQDFPHLEIIINGGIATNQEIDLHLQHVDGVMIGREAYHNPMVMNKWDQLFYGSAEQPISYARLVEKLFLYSRACMQADNGITLRHIVRHYLGLMHGLNKARVWRRMLSDSALLKNNDSSLILTAWKEIAQANHSV